MDYTKKQQHIVYQVLDESGNYMYIGSTGLSLERLEYNHRHFRERNYSETRFRKALESNGANWVFSILYQGNCTKERIEELEGIAIREAITEHNYDMHPLETSRSYGRL